MELKIKLNSNQREDVEGVSPEYPYALHHDIFINSKVPWHWHEEVEFTYVLQGTVTIHTANRNYNIHKGQGYFLNTNVLAMIEGDSECIMDTHLVHPTLLGGHFMSIYEKKYLNPVLQNRKIEVVEFRGDTKEQIQILEKIKKASILQAQENTEFQVRNIFSEIWLLLLEEINNLKEPEHFSHSVNQERILTMMSYIQENYAEKLSLEMIASSATISTREALRCFQFCIQQTPFEYLMSHRIEMAKKLLRSTNLSVTDIAVQTGFSNSAYFSKIFKRECHTTPLAYRREVRET
ncbi:MAG: AraC family transcriptional regulator [Lachnospiraceae bacterium]|nr:helix-turn-helix transcriptional regulator [Lachnospiraceae bacterium]MEE1014769.1 AraC family transcriptional regulator [Lachnospiraceae bacterium]